MRFHSLALVSAVAIAAAACSESDEPLAPSDGEAPVLERGTDEGEGTPTRRYQITIENLTSGQPLSPGVVVTHRGNVRLFANGRRASPGIQAIAEDGDPATAAAMLPGVKGVFAVVATAAPVFPIGGIGPSTLSLVIDAGPGASRLSLALMLICTNDGFAGLGSVRLPHNRNPRVFYARAYDAGTEENDEASTSIVDPCFAIGPVSGAADGNATNPSGGTVRHHPGIRGGGDLSPAAHGWDGPIARVTVQRIG